MAGHEVKEWTYIHKDGSHLTVSLTVTALRNGAGDMRGYLGMAINITERKKAEQEQVRLTSILEATSDFVGSAGIDGRAQYLNRAGRRMAGFADDEDITKFSIPSIHPAWATEIITTEGIPVPFAMASGAAKLRFCIAMGMKHRYCR